MQSHNYVPNISGWNLDKVTGELEINSAKISVGGLPEQPQMITVTAGEWPARDLPESAIEHYAFIGSEISKIPGEYRASAEIVTFDDSYEPGFVDIRTKLTYQRPETAEEMAARIKASRSPGHSIKFDGDKLTFSYDGVPHTVLGNLDKAAEKPDTPFVVEDDQVFLSQAFIEASKFSLKTQLTANGIRYASGFGIGCMCKGGYTRTPADKAEKAEVKIGCTVDVSKALDQISKVLSTTELAQSLESVTAKIEHEVTARATADTQLSARIGALEGRISASGSNITQQGAAITPLK